MDLTLIDRLDRIAEGSTDRLTLESISSDAAFLDWAPPESSLAALAKLGFSGRRSPHSFDPDAASESGNGSLPARRIYAFDLRDKTPAEVIEAILALKSSREVKTFSLGGLGAMNGSKREPSSKPADVAPAAKAIDPTTDVPRAAKVASDQTVDPPAVRATDSKPDNLDRLIDQLDDLDV